MENLYLYANMMHTAEENGQLNIRQEHSLQLKEGMYLPRSGKVRQLKGNITYIGTKFQVFALRSGD